MALTAAGLAMGIGAPVPLTPVRGIEQTFAVEVPRW